ncbi:MULTISPECIES: type IV secretion system protein [unclassified Bartonella]|uniref:type IV secretion system protein n=1 Tax=unclassified Bartonella TaxID=2645622 RepID=UPI0009C3101A|nr:MULTISPECIES: type IV secretion system protein [unclassified Bartonella]AQX27875.1 Type IV secretion system protein [Bartonella sp. JB15]AQX27899.1 Type IV secretion system protein [Bartonella sp. JB15]AQX28658.1 Type IV secretion system protein [Bartonella sp. JB15]AQX29155.1 Type IV secretion system protein [Bartonella sp. JB63]AQX29179.1 Type IV secretion system protein [Bartonella sp. JB63]
MKKFIIMLLSSSFISHGVSGATEDSERYYKSVIEDTTSEETKLKIAESIYASATKNEKEIQEISQKILSETDEKKRKDLESKLAILQAKLQVDILKLQALSIIKSENSQSKEKKREEEQEKKHEIVHNTLKEELEKAKNNIKIR